MKKLSSRRRIVQRSVVIPLSVMVPLGLAGVAYAADGAFNSANPHSYDPAHTSLVTSGWINGIGCPTNAIVANPNAGYTGVGSTSPYTDAACPTGDPSDNHNQGLLLSKTGPTNNFAAAQVQLNGIKKGTTLTELGFDIRGGSHCSAGAPRFEVVTDQGNDWNIGCSTGTKTTSSTEWSRMRWSSTNGTLVGYDASNGYAYGAVTGTVKSISIIMDEGQDADPIGLAVLDNVDVNATLVGHGSNGDS